MLVLGSHMAKTGILNPVMELLLIMFYCLGRLLPDPGNGLAHEEVSLRNETADGRAHRRLAFLPAVTADAPPEPASHSGLGPQKTR